MESITNEMLPRILPLWHSSTFHKHKCHSCQVDFKLIPDFGGVGVDICMKPQSSTENVNHSSPYILKSNINTEYLSTENCVLPFTFPNVLDNLYEPCCEQLKQLQERERLFYKHMFCIVQSSNKSIEKSYSFLEKMVSTKNEEQDEFIVPESINKLIETIPDTIPVPRMNWLYSGGCLTSVKCNNINDGTSMLIHPGGKQFNEVIITHLAKSSDNQKIFTYCNQQRFQVIDPILQISTHSFQEKSLSFIRQIKCGHIILLQPDNIQIERVFKNFSNPLLYSCVSPYIFGEYLVLTKNGDIMVRNIEEDINIWKLSQINNDPVPCDTWQGCDFGSHPRNICYSNCKSLSSFDVRSHSRCMEIFSTASCSFLSSSEEITLFKLNVLQPFQHIVSTTNHMLVCDERYPKQPVLVWNHLLDSFPMYCDVVPITDSEFQILLGTHFPQQVACFNLKSSLNIQPVSCLSPLHLSVPKDFLEYLKIEGINIEHSVLKRLTAPIIGACSVIHNQDCAFFQVSSLGDVFYTDNFINSKERKTPSIGPDCSFKSIFNKSDFDWWLEETKSSDIYFNKNVTSTEPLIQHDCSLEFNNLKNCVLNASEIYAFKNDHKQTENILKNDSIKKSNKDEVFLKNLNKNIFCYENMDSITKSMLDVWYKKE